MPQLVISPYEVAHAVDVRLQLNIDRPGGTVTVRIEDEHGRTLARASKSWRTERDLNGMSRAIADVIDLFMWGDASRLEMALGLALRDHLPPVMPAVRSHASRRARKKDDR